jgi:predicted nucleic acid-binding protein
VVRYVVDANVLVQACIDEGGLGPLEGHEILVPPIAASDTVSSLREMGFRGEISAELGRLALESFLSLKYSVENPPGLWDAATDVAGRLGWAKTYDAEYVALARLLGCPLVTLDARMARGARQLAQILGPAELP